MTGSANAHSRVRQQFITNCITRILVAPCLVSREIERVRDIARSVAIAAEEGEAQAHMYLHRLMEEAEAGVYEIEIPEQER